jgi:hypothetical protein
MLAAWKQVECKQVVQASQRGVPGSLPLARRLAVPARPEAGPRARSSQRQLCVSHKRKRRPAHRSSGRCSLQQEQPIRNVHRLSCCQSWETPMGRIQASVLVTIVSGDGRICIGVCTMHQREKMNLAAIGIGSDIATEWSRRDRSGHCHERVK